MLARDMTLRRLLGELGLPIILLGLLAAVVLAQANPLFTLPNPDGGYNMFAGSQILKGRLPYVDFWNTKGPGIYYLNALALSLGHGLRWGVWIVEYAFLFCSILLLFVLMRRQWGMGAAAFGVIVAMVALSTVLNGGNLTEEYPLLFNSIALYLYWQRERTASFPPEKHAASGDAVDYLGPWRYLLIGCMAGLSFSFRANNIGIPAAIGLAMLLQEGRRRRLRALLSKSALMGAGFIIPVGLGLLYFWVRGALPNYVEAVYLYNVRYAGSRSHLLNVLTAGFSAAKVGWPSWIALAGAGMALVGFVRKLVRAAAASGFEIVLALMFWIEIALASVSWRTFGHYYISWVPAIAVLSALLFAEMGRWLRRDWLDWFVQGQQPVALFSGLIVAVALVSQAEVAQYARTVSRVLFHRAEGIELRDYLSNYVARHTRSNESVLTWPGNAWINFASDRESPVRLVFYPVFDAGTITAEQGQGYLDDLATHRPALLIDCSDLHSEIPSLDPATRAVQEATRDFLFDPPYIQQVFDYVASHYHVETKTARCTLYRVNP